MQFPLNFIPKFWQYATDTVCSTTIPSGKCLIFGLQLTQEPRMAQHFCELWVRWLVSRVSKLKAADTDLLWKKNSERCLTRAVLYRKREFKIQNFLTREKNEYLLTDFHIRVTNINFVIYSMMKLNTHHLNSVKFKFHAIPKTNIIPVGLHIFYLFSSFHFNFTLWSERIWKKSIISK